MQGDWGSRSGGRGGEEERENEIHVSNINSEFLSIDSSGFAVFNKKTVKRIFTIL